MPSARTLIEENDCRSSNGIGATHRKQIDIPNRPGLAIVLSWCPLGAKGDRNCGESYRPLLAAKGGSGTDLLSLGELLREKKW